LHIRCDDLLIPNPQSWPALREVHIRSAVAAISYETLRGWTLENPEIAQCVERRRNRIMRCSMW